ncbi:MAG: 16S rRNA (cytosine(1402)-N(4))-methyltransferase RsmH [Patescibacteria group bacterium]
MSHVSVLLQEVISGLSLKEGNIFLDATLGNAGHSETIAPLLGLRGTLIGLDRDLDRIVEAKKVLEGVPCKVFVRQANFRNLDLILDELGLQKIDCALFDLGLNSEQLQVSGRGFSFQKDEPLLMTFEKEITEETLTAFKIVNGWTKEDIADLLFEYGEEGFSRRIAEKIVEQRKNKTIETTSELVEIIKRATPSWYSHRRIHPATKTFQALRIAVNDEIQSLKDGLSKCFDRLNEGGRMAVISFHSGEDRIVKNFFREKAKEGVGILINKKVIKPAREEEVGNPRSRSAKLRIIQKQTS